MHEDQSTRRAHTMFRPQSSWCRRVPFRMTLRSSRSGPSAESGLDTLNRCVRDAIGPVQKTNLHKCLVRGVEPTHAHDANMSRAPPRARVGVTYRPPSVALPHAAAACAVPRAAVSLSERPMNHALRDPAGLERGVNLRSLQERNQGTRSLCVVRIASNDGLQDRGNL